MALTPIAREKASNHLSLKEGYLTSLFARQQTGNNDTAKHVSYSSVSVSVEASAGKESWARQRPGCAGNNEKDYQRLYGVAIVSEDIRQVLARTISIKGNRTQKRSGK